MENVPARIATDTRFNKGGQCTIDAERMVSPAQRALLDFSALPFPDPHSWPSCSSSPVNIFQFLLLCVGLQPLLIRLIVPGLKCRVEIRGDGRKVVQSAWSRPLWSTVDVRDNPPANNLRLISMQQKVSGFSETRRRGVQACVPIPAREQY